MNGEWGWGFGLTLEDSLFQFANAVHSAQVTVNLMIVSLHKKYRTIGFALYFTSTKFMIMLLKFHVHTSLYPGKCEPP